jgi:hypothetical protein
VGYGTLAKGPRRAGGVYRVDVGRAREGRTATRVANDDEFASKRRHNVESPELGVGQTGELVWELPSLTRG